MAAALRRAASRSSMSAAVSLWVEAQHGLAHRESLEGLTEVEAGALVVEDGSAEHGLRHAAQQVLGQVHQVTVVRVGLIELEHGELGVVPGGQALIAEVAIDLVDPLKPAHHQPLEIQLGGDAQEQFHVERVVMGDEGTRHGPAGDHVHHRRLHLQERPLIQIVADVGDDGDAGAEGVAGGLVDDQVDVALPVASLHVRQPMPLFGQGPQGLGEQPQGVAAHRQLTGLGEEEGPHGCRRYRRYPDRACRRHRRPRPRYRAGRRVESGRTYPAGGRNSPCP